MNVSEIVEKVRTKQVSAQEILKSYLDRIDQKDFQIKAFLDLYDQQAIQDAQDIDDKVQKGQQVGPLAGVPIGIKDNLCIQGRLTTAGSKILSNWHSPYDATVIKKLRQAGAIIVGKTNLDEFAMGSSTENSAFGPTCNPHNLSKVPGGSSGGSAAAVAADMVPLALGSDTGGSIRQPASLCGVVGIKPTYGRVSRFGLIAFASSLDQIGPFGKTVQDAIMALEAISGSDPFDSTSLDQSPFHFEQGSDSVKGLRVGIVSELMDGIALDVKASVQKAISVLEQAGAKVDTVSIPSAPLGLSAYYLIAPAEASSNLSRYDGVRFGLRHQADDITTMYETTRGQGFGAEVKRRIMLGTYALSSGYYDAYYSKAQKIRTLIINDFAKAYDNFDVLISATSPTTAFDFDAKVDDPLSMYLSDVCTIPSNLAGHPAMSVPFGKGQDSMPIGIQVMAPALGEQVMLQVGLFLEQAANDIF